MMKKGRWGEYLIFIGITVVFSGILYLCFSAFILRPFFVIGSFESRMMHALLGFGLLVVFNPIKDGFRIFVDRIVQKHKVDYDRLKKELIAICNMHADFQETMNKIQETVKKHLKVEQVLIFTRIDGTYYTYIDDKEHTIANENLVLKQLTQNKFTPLYINDILVKHDESLWRFMKEKNIIYVLPLNIGDGNLIGWVCLRDSRSNYRLYSSDLHELPLIQSFLTIGLHHARVDQKIHDKFDELIALNRISQTMNSSLNVNETLESIMDAVIELANVDRALMYLQNENDHFIPTISRGQTSDINLNFKIDPQQSIFDHVLQSREPLVVSDSENDQRVNQEYAGFVKTKSFALIPIVTKEKVIGIIGVDNLFTNRPVEEIKVDLLVTLANHAAIAISNSRLYERTQQFNEELQEEVRQATKHLEQLLDMKSHFLQVASHQLRTPTTILRGLLSLILEDPEMPEEELRKSIGQAYSVVNRLDRIIAELLSATELEDTIDRPIIEKVNLVELIEQIVNVLRPLAHDRGNQLIVNIPEFMDEIYSNPFKLKEAISNLIDNALRYTRDGSVSVKVEAHKDMIHVRVIDTGVGLTDEDKKMIFDKFCRGTNIAQVEPNGTGLGLFIVQKIAEMLEGEIQCNSKGEGKGSEFTLIFPNIKPQT